MDDNSRALLARYKRIYLATPYTHYEGGRGEAFIKAAQIAAKLAEKGLHVFSPIVHGHCLVSVGGCKHIDTVFWLDVDRPWFDCCDLLLIVLMDGWQKSAGIKAEMQWARERQPQGRMPIYFLNPDTLEVI